LVRDLGAERFISTGAGRPGPAAGGCDVGIDTVGGAVLDGSAFESGGRARRPGKTVFVVR